MNRDLERRIEELQEENRQLHQALEQKAKVANRALASYQQRALHMEIIRQQNEDLDKLTADLTQARQAAEERVRREQTIREITTQMQTATTLKELVKITAEALNARFSAAYTLIELGIEEMVSPPSEEPGGTFPPSGGPGRPGPKGK